MLDDERDMDDRFVERECLDCPEVTGPFHTDRVPGVQEDLGKEIEALLGAVHDLDLTCSCRDIQAVSVPVRDIFPKGEITIGGSILQGDTCVLFKDLTGCPCNPLAVDEFR